MGKTRYVHGWECPICYQLYPTKKRVMDCFKECLIECLIQDDKEHEVILLKGHECIDCLKLHNREVNAKKCCNPEYSQETEPKDTYNVIGRYRRRKKQFAFRSKKKCVKSRERREKFVKRSRDEK